MMTRKCLKASAQARQGNSSFLSVMREGERAKMSGKTIADCPYDKGDDNREVWMDGFTDESV